MPDREKIIKEFEDFVKSFSKRDDTYYKSLFNCVLALLKEQEEQKRKLLQTIADIQLAVSPTGYETEEELAKRTGERNGLQMAWEILTKE